MNSADTLVLFIYLEIIQLHTPSFQYFIVFTWLEESVYICMSNNYINSRVPYSV